MEFSCMVQSTLLVRLWIVQKLQSELQLLHQLVSEGMRCSLVLDS